MSERKVSKEELEQYISEYPGKLEVGVHRSYEPPLITHNDFTKGDWPKSVVAYEVAMDGSDYYGGKTSEYFIKESQA